MAVKGQRFHIDLDSDDEDSSERTLPSQTAYSAPQEFSFVGDVVERSSASEAKVPSPPKPNKSSTGFPTHKKRSGQSKFKPNRGHEVSTPSRLPRAPPANSVLSEQENPLLNSASIKDSRQSHGEQDITKEQIDAENRQRLAQMSEAEIEQERSELMTGLSSSLLERFLKRANVDSGGIGTGNEPDLGDEAHRKQPRSLDYKADNAPRSKSSKTVTFQDPESDSSSCSPLLAPLPAQSAPTAPPTADPDAPPAQPPPDLHPASINPLPPLTLPQPPNPLSTPPRPLSPSSPTFLSTLHETYFPSLPSSPSSLAWLAPLPNPTSPSSLSSPYSPSHPSLPPSSLRFSFTGSLIPPSLARDLPTTLGLHHHGDAPESAGYTIPELALLARSSVAAQRCIAYRVLGRVLWRLGSGEFDRTGARVGRGAAEEDAAVGDVGNGGREGVGQGELTKGLWAVVERERVIEVMLREAERGGDAPGSRSAWAMAVEAVWLWRKGGGRTAAE